MKNFIILLLFLTHVVCAEDGAHVAKPKNLGWFDKCEYVAIVSEKSEVVIRLKDTGRVPKNFIKENREEFDDFPQVMIIRLDKERGSFVHMHYKIVDGEIHIRPNPNLPSLVKVKVTDIISNIAPDSVKELFDKIIPPRPNP